MGDGGGLSADDGDGGGLGTDGSDRSTPCQGGGALARGGRKAAATRADVKKKLFCKQFILSQYFDKFSLV